LRETLKLSLTPPGRPVQPRQVFRPFTAPWRQRLDRDLHFMIGFCCAYRNGDS